MTSPIDNNQDAQTTEAADAAGIRAVQGPRDKAVLVGIHLPGSDDLQFESSLVELGRLADTLGLEVVGQVTQRRDSLAVAVGIGGGKLKELAKLTGGPGEVPGYIPLGVPRETPEPLPGTVDADERATIVLVDQNLSPRQTRNLELATGAEVLDRSMVVVSIFQRHARSREAKLQVEIARLAYMAPRLREAGADQDRQRGGIGGKGAGETTLELNRRQIRDRIADLRRELRTAVRTASTQKNSRGEHPTVAVVGYTNAGKSSLMRKLTGDTMYVADQLFATLDTTVRMLQPKTRPPILVSDTVGFIKNLPHDLVASFRSTLEEAKDASLLLHLVDASDPAFRDQMRVTTEVLTDIGANAGEHLLLLNKSDRLSPEVITELKEEFAGAVIMSVKNDNDIAALHARIVDHFEQGMQEQQFYISYRDQAHVATLHARCRVLREKHDEEGTHITVRAPKATLASLAYLFAPDSAPDPNARVREDWE